MGEESELDENGAGYAAAMRGQVSFENVSFRYGEKTVLRNVSFHVQPGQTVAIVGRTGAGKTTLTKLINRIYDASEGRVLLQDPALVILDEATASVDPLTEEQIQEALDEVLAGRTSIVIAHRLSTVRNADRILVLDSGRIVEEGSHAALLSRGGQYAHLYNTYFRHQSANYRPGEGFVRTASAATRS